MALQEGIGILCAQKADEGKVFHEGIVLGPVLDSECFYVGLEAALQGPLGNTAWQALAV